MQEVVGAIVIQGGKMLLTLSDNKVLTPPGGKKKDGETDRQCAERELLEELGTRINFGKFFSRFETVTPASKKRVVVSCYFVELLGEPEPRNEIIGIRWSDCPEKLNLSDGTRTLITQLRKAHKF